MKRTISFALALIFIAAALIGCAGKKENPAAEGEVTEEAKKQIGNPSALGADAEESSTLPTIKIVSESGKPIKKKEYEGATVSAEGATEEEQNFSSLHAEVKCRGNYTFTGTKKKSYRVKFDEKINLFGQGSGKAKSWVLMAEHCDQTFMRNHIAFAMANLLDGIEYVSSSSFVHLYINDEYQGIYHVVEQHQVGKSRVNINEDPAVTDTDYFIEWDAYAGEDGICGVNWFYVSENKFLVKSDNMTEDKCTFLSNYFNEAYAALQSGKQSDVEKYLDLPSFVDMYILHEISKNIDVGWSSFFFVKKAGGKISCTCPWDFDLAFGNDERLDSGSAEGMYVGNSEYAFGWWNRLDQGNEWLCYLMRQKWFVDMVVSRWNEKAKELQDCATGEIDRIYNCFADEIEKNFDVWNIWGQKINQEPRQIRDLHTYKEHVDYLRDWVNDRFKWMDDYFKDEKTKYQTTEYKEDDPWGPWQPWDPDDPWGGWSPPIIKD